MAWQFARTPGCGCAMGSLISGTKVRVPVRPIQIKAFAVFFLDERTLFVLYNLYRGTGAIR